MKISICGGFHQTSYIIEMFKKDKRRKNKLVVINDNPTNAKILANKFNIPIVVGDFTKTYTLEEGDIVDSDLFISLSENDQDNYVACLMAKNIYNCKKVLCTVTNPSFVPIFKKLGIDIAISSSYLIGETIKNESNVEDVFKSLSIDDNLIKIIQFKVKDNHSICNQELKDIKMPDYATISAIVRNHKIIIPKGKTLILKDDNVTIVLNASYEEEFLDFIKKL